jgi:hypothetical protein
MTSSEQKLVKINECKNEIHDYLTELN